MWRCLSLSMGYRSCLTPGVTGIVAIYLSCLLISESDTEKFCILKLGVSILNKILNNELLIYVVWVLQCYSSCLIISLSDLAKPVDQLLPPGDWFIKPTMLCVNKGAQSNMFSFTEILQILNGL